jgi:hypothetical protein
VHERCAGDGLIGPDDLIEALIEDSRFGACAARTVDSATWEAVSVLGLAAVPRISHDLIRAVRGV